MAPKQKYVLKRLRKSRSDCHIRQHRSITAVGKFVSDIIQHPVSSVCRQKRKPDIQRVWMYVCYGGSTVVASPMRHDGKLSKYVQQRKKARFLYCSSILYVLFFFLLVFKCYCQIITQITSRLHVHGCKIRVSQFLQILWQTQTSDAQLVPEHFLLKPFFYLMNI